MKLSASENGSLEMQEIPPVLFQFLREIPSRAASQDPCVENRFYPIPAEDEVVVEDWNSLVQPELQALFLSNREVVLADLRAASEEQGTFSLEIPPNHLEPWMNALNQARLAMAEENHFQEKDLSEEVLPDPSNPRAFLLFQINFYGFLLECLVRMLE